MEGTENFVCTRTRFVLKKITAPLYKISTEKVVDHVSTVTFPHSSHSNDLVCFTAWFFRTDLTGLEDLSVGADFDAWTDRPDWADLEDCTVTLDCTDIADPSDWADFADWADFVDITDLAEILDWPLKTRSGSEASGWIRVGFWRFNGILRRTRNEMEPRYKIKLIKILFNSLFKKKKQLVE